MITQIFLSGHIGRGEALILTAEDARRTNSLCKEHNVTGLTLYREGDFLSVLEGTEHATHLVAEAIGADPRLTKAEMMYQDKKENREFEIHSIGFASVDYSNDVPNAFRLTPESFCESIPPAPSPVLRALTNGFAKVHNLLPPQTKQ